MQLALPAGSFAVAALAAAALLLATPTPARAKTTLYVSKLGSGKGGRSWADAFTTVQAALSAVPDGGGCRIIVRPDVYFEANLYTGARGAEGAYNELIGDTDGKLGGGTAGRVVIDSSDPDQKGLKSYDWWGPIRATSKGWSPEHTEETFSAIGWDRWRLKGLYVTGGDGGIFFDTTDHKEPFTVVVEDCVGIGRAFGGGCGGSLSRPDEPITFRRCQLYALDWWGDTAAAYIRIENDAMPERPDALIEDCTLVSPQCALKSSNYGFHTFSRIAVRRSRLIVLNFSQPVGTPSDGIIVSMQEGKLLHVELEDSLLAGYKVFGCKVNPRTVGEIGCTIRGDVKAYVQYQQELPKGIYRLAGWPEDLLDCLAPPKNPRVSPLGAPEMVRKEMCEMAPFVWKGRLCHMDCVRPATGGTAADYKLVFTDAAGGAKLGECGQGYGLASIIVHRGRAYVYASRMENGGWHDVTLFSSADLVHWDKQVAITGENEELFNSSVCKGPDGFVMTYESNDPRWPAFTVKLAKSKDLVHWEKLPEATFGTNRYTACPCIRYADGWYYVLYLERRAPRWWFETYITRSKDLKHWELSAANPVLRPEGLDESINASDPEMTEWRGKTYVYYCVGDQLSWANVKRAAYPGKLADFLKGWYTQPGIPDIGAIGYGAPEVSRMPRQRRSSVSVKADNRR